MMRSEAKGAVSGSAVDVDEIEIFVSDVDQGE